MSEDRARLIGDEIEFRGFVVARRPANMPLTMWDAFADLATADPIDEDAAFERGEAAEAAAHAEEVEDLRQDIARLEEKARFSDERAEQAYKDGLQDGRAENTDSRVATLKARLKR